MNPSMNGPMNAAGATGAMNNGAMNGPMSSMNGMMAAFPNSMNKLAMQVSYPATPPHKINNNQFQCFHPQDPYGSQSTGMNGPMYRGRHAPYPPPAQHSSQKRQQQHHQQQQQPPQQPQQPPNYGQAMYGPSQGPYGMAATRPGFGSQYPSAMGGSGYGPAGNNNVMMNRGAGMGPMAPSAGAMRPAPQHMNINATYGQTGGAQAQGAYAPAYANVNAAMTSQSQQQQYYASQQQVQQQQVQQQQQQQQQQVQQQQHQQQHQQQQQQQQQQQVPLERILKHPQASPSIPKHPN